MQERGHNEDNMHVWMKKIKKFLTFPFFLFIFAAKYYIFFAAMCVPMCIADGRLKGRRAWTPELTKETNLNICDVYTDKHLLS